jgi:hypothetical protein
MKPWPCQVRPTDYHFAIQDTCGTIWASRREHPELLGDPERLCLLDIALLEAKPDSLRANDGQMALILTFELLVRLYQREGLYEKALEIAKRGAALEQGEEVVNRLQQLVDDLRAEDAE